MTNIYDQDDFFEGYKQKRNHALSYNETLFLNLFDFVIF